MKMKNQYSKHSYSSRLKKCATSSFQLRLHIICLTLLPFHLLTSLTQIAYAKSATEVSQKLPQSSFSFPKDPNNSRVRQLWRAKISIANGKEDQESKDRLRRTIEQIRSVNLSPQKHIPEPVIGPVQMQVPEVPEPNETPSRTIVPEKEDKKEIESKLPDEMITGRTLQILKNLSERPEELENPFELGEVLFLSGNFGEAAAFYQEALKRKHADDVSSVEDRAWILFQIGNCLRHYDMPTATKTYGQLITEYPNSPWTDLAEAQAKLIDWQQRDEPHKLIAERKP